MRRLQWTVVIVPLLFLLPFLMWKVWTILTLEIDVYSRVQVEQTARRRIISRCKAFENRKDLQNGQKVEEKKSDKCFAGSIPQNGKCSPCPQGMFSFPEWISCVKHLDCDQIHYNIRPVKDLFSAGNWQFKAAEWRGYQVLYAEKQKEISIDQDIIGDISKTSAILQPIGFCSKTGAIVFTHSSRIKDTAKQLDSRLILDSKCDNWIVRFRLAIDFVRELARLHSASDGPVVLCNSQSLDQTLKQFAITENWELILVGFDNLQQRKGNSLVKCSDNELRGTFIAPEQLWPYAGTKVFNIEQQPGYTETSDIWKIPDVTETLLGTSKKAQNVLDYLLLIHYICKSSDPQSRPSAAEVLKHYEEVWSVLVN